MGTPPTGALNARVVKVAISDQYLAIARKRLKIDGYRPMLLCDLTSIESSFHPCKIYRDCPRGVHRGGQNLQKNVLKWRTFELTGWITGKRLKIDGYISLYDAFDKHWILFSSMWYLPRLSQGRTHYPGEAKMCLRLIAETDARSVGDSHPSCWLHV